MEIKFEFELKNNKQRNNFYVNDPMILMLVL